MLAFCTYSSRRGVQEAISKKVIHRDVSGGTKILQFLVLIFKQNKMQLFVNLKRIFERIYNRCDK